MRTFTNRFTALFLTTALTAATACMAGDQPEGDDYRSPKKAAVLAFEEGNVYVVPSSWYEKGGKYGTTLSSYVTVSDGKTKAAYKLVANQQYEGDLAATTITLRDLEDPGRSQTITIDDTRIEVVYKVGGVERKANFYEHDLPSLLDERAEEIMEYGARRRMPDYPLFEVTAESLRYLQQRELTSLDLQDLEVAGTLLADSIDSMEQNDPRSLYGQLSGEIHGEQLPVIEATEGSCDTRAGETCEDREEWPPYSDLVALGRRVDSCNQYDAKEETSAAGSGSLMGATAKVEAGKVSVSAGITNGAVLRSRQKQSGAAMQSLTYDCRASGWDAKYDTKVQATYSGEATVWCDGDCCYDETEDSVTGVKAELAVGGEKVAATAQESKGKAIAGQWKVSGSAWACYHWGYVWNTFIASSSENVQTVSRLN